MSENLSTERRDALDQYFMRQGQPELRMQRNFDRAIARMGDRWPGNRVASETQVDAESVLLQTISARNEKPRNRIAALSRFLRSALIALVVFGPKAAQAPERSLLHAHSRMMANSHAPQRPIEPAWFTEETGKSADDEDRTIRPAMIETIVTPRTIEEKMLRQADANTGRF